MTQSHFPRRILLGILALTVGAVGISGCNRGATAPQQAVVPVNPGTQVSTTAAKTASISDTADVTGALISEQDVNVGVKMAGKVVAVYAREGDVIRAGQVVVQQDTTDLQNQVDQQRANLLSARTRLEQSQLVYKNAVTTLKWTEDQTQSAVHLAEAGLEAAKEQASIVKQGARPQERQQAEENLSAAKADRDKARADLKRYQDLYREQAISAQQLDQAQAIVDSADARYNGAAQALSLVKEGSRPEDIRRSQAAVEQAHQQVVSSQSNRDQVNLRRSDMVNARVGILSAEAGLRQAQAGLRLAEQAVKDATVRSPIDGIVAERKIEPGMQAGAGRDVMRIVSLNSIYFDAQLSESQYAKVRVGMGVKVSIDALASRSVEGKVKKVFPVASSTARSFTARISLPNPEKVLRPQMFARGQIVLETHANVVVVPRDAILDLTENSGRVFVANGGVAEERKVKVGLSTVYQAEIASGVSAGDAIVTIGQTQLQDKDKIQLKN